MVVYVEVIILLLGSSTSIPLELNVKVTLRRGFGVDVVVQEVGSGAGISNIFSL